jgi:hypothetical protein
MYLYTKKYLDAKEKISCICLPFFWIHLLINAKEKISMSVYFGFRFFCGLGKVNQKMQQRLPKRITQPRPRTPADVRGIKMLEIYYRNLCEQNQKGKG